MHTPTQTLKKLFYRIKYKHRQPEMVQYWLTKDSTIAKVTTAKEGHNVMLMEGEKYPFPGYPRGALLYGNLSPLKHWIKNWIFNDSWKKLEEGVDEKEILSKLKSEVLPKIFELGVKCRHDMVDYSKLVPAVKELWRAMSEVERKVSPETAYKVKNLKEILCFILQEDDAYRFRLQYIAQFFNPKSIWRRITGRKVEKDFELALTLLEHAEVVGDMKERIRLLRRILLMVLRDEGVRRCFDLLNEELDWKKLRLKESDKYFLRAKYFKADYPFLEY